MFHLSWNAITVFIICSKFNLEPDRMLTNRVKSKLTAPTRTTQQCQTCGFICCNETRNYLQLRRDLIIHFTSEVNHVSLFFKTFYSFEIAAKADILWRLCLQVKLLLLCNHSSNFKRYLPLQTTVWPADSVTRWQNYLSILAKNNNENLTNIKKTCPISFKILSNTKYTLKENPKTFKVYQSGEISENLVTLPADKVSKVNQP